MSLYNFKCVITYNNGTPARTEIITAVNPPQAKDIAERQFGGKCRAANQCGRA